MGSSVKLHRVELAKVDEFKYLGSMVQENGKYKRQRNRFRQVGANGGRCQALSATGSCQLG